jgi:hypothetical protein
MMSLVSANFAVPAGFDPAGDECLFIMMFVHNLGLEKQCSCRCMHPPVATAQSLLLISQSGNTTEAILELVPGRCRPSTRHGLASRL